jgi:hypothetical protein
MRTEKRRTGDGETGRKGAEEKRRLEAENSIRQLADRERRDKNLQH